MSSRGWRVQLSKVHGSLFPFLCYKREYMWEISCLEALATETTMKELVRNEERKKGGGATEDIGSG